MKKLIGCTILLQKILKLSGYFGAAVSRIYLFPLYFLSGFVPRKDNLWVFGSWGGHRYADNGAAFFEHCNQHITNYVEPVWISRKMDIVRKVRSKGYKAYWIWSPRGMLCCLRARLYIYDCFSKDINFWLSRGAEHINLWSGVPLKTFERDIDHPSGRYYRLFHGSLPERLLLGCLMPWHVRSPDHVICTSDETRKIICSAFAVNVGQVHITGYPRNDIFFEPDDGMVGLPAGFTTVKKSGKYCMLYLPTFRDSGTDYHDINWSELDALMSELNAHFFIKFHPVDASAFEGEFENITLLPSEIEVYDVLAHTDAMISDYSSLVWDYMLLDKPLFYYVPDLEEFVTSSRSFNFDIREVAIGPVCESFAELSAAITQVVSGISPESLAPATRAEIVPRIHHYVDGNASSRVLQVLESHVLRDALVVTR